MAGTKASMRAASRGVILSTRPCLSKNLKLGALAARRRVCLVRQTNITADRSPHPKPCTRVFHVGSRDMPDHILVRTALHNRSAPELRHVNDPELVHSNPYPPETRGHKLRSPVAALRISFFQFPRLVSGVSPCEHRAQVFSFCAATVPCLKKPGRLRVSPKQPSMSFTPAYTCTQGVKSKA
jgi:hypothetical protein